MRIYLAGFMASGKSTVGPKLAERMGMAFVDLDDRIEAEAGMTIPEIFGREGELGFRQRETAALWATASDDEAVVALGGGTIVDDANRDFARDHGLLVFLRVDADAILDRVADEAAHRPLLQDESGTPLSRTAMRQRIERLLSERRSAYEQAHATVDAHRPPDELAAVLEEIATVYRHTQDADG